MTEIGNGNSFVGQECDRAKWEYFHGGYMVITFPDGKELFTQSSDDIEQIMGELGVDEWGAGDWDWIPDDWPYYGDYYNVAQLPED